MEAKRKHFLWALAILLGGCSSTRVALDDHSITAASLLGSQLLSAEPVDIPHQEMLSLSPEMRAFVDAHVGAHERPVDRWDALAGAVTSPELLSLTYSEATLTAADAFETKSGNCLSYSAMLVALARYAGLDAKFHEVDVPPDWTDRSGVMIRWQHINVVIDLGPQGLRVLDFDSAGDTAGLPGEVVSDERGAAHFLNNLGVTQLEADAGLAFAYFKEALELQPDFTPAWNNLGALYGRHGHRDYAESAYLHSLSLNPRDITAMHNLVRLYEIEGNADAAADYASRVARYRDSNPYYHYGLAQRALSDGRLEAAERHVRDALRRKDDEHRFHLLRAAILAARGEADRAERSRRLAASLIAGVRE